MNGNVFGEIGFLLLQQYPIEVELFSYLTKIHPKYIQKFVVESKCPSFKMSLYLSFPTQEVKCLVKFSKSQVFKEEVCLFEGHRFYLCSLLQTSSWNWIHHTELTQICYI